MATSATVRASVASDGSELIDGATQGTITGDGTKMAFVGSDGVLRVHTIDGPTVTVASQALDAIISGDGSTVAFRSRGRLVDGMASSRVQPEAFVGNL